MSAGSRTTSCPKCGSRRIQLVADALQTTAGLPSREGMAWKCLDCDHKWTDDHGNVA